MNLGLKDAANSILDQKPPAYVLTDEEKKI